MQQISLLGKMKASLIFIVLAGVLGYAAAQNYPVCLMYCPCGYVEILGCPICACKLCLENCPPVCEIYCPCGNVEILGCPICKCKSCPEQCSPIMCDMYCEHGFVEVAGCPICKCNICPPSPQVG